MKKRIEALTRLIESMKDGDPFRTVAVRQLQVLELEQAELDMAEARVNAQEPHKPHRPAVKIVHQPKSTQSAVAGRRKVSMAIAITDAKGARKVYQVRPHTGRAARPNTIASYQVESPEGELYEVNLDCDGVKRCNCKGHIGAGNCKHADALEALQLLPTALYRRFRHLSAFSPYEALPIANGPMPVAKVIHLPPPLPANLLARPLSYCL